LKETEFALGLRIPAWCTKERIVVNGEYVPCKPTEQGFVYLKRAWAPSDRVEITFPMGPRVVRGHETPIPKIPSWSGDSYHVRGLAQRADATFPYEYVIYGPLVFALPIPDKNPNEPEGGTAWNYALDVRPDEAETDIEVVYRGMKRPWNWPLDAPIKLIVPARQFEWKPTGTQPLPTSCVTGGKAAKIKLVPYSCTKFRVSMFPITERMSGAKANSK